MIILSFCNVVQGYSKQFYINTPDTMLTQLHKIYVIILNSTGII